MQNDLISRKNLVDRSEILYQHTASGKTIPWAAIRVCAINNAPTIDAIPVVRCKDCKHRGTPYSCPMRKLVMPFQGAGSYEDCTEDDGYCHMGELKDGGAC